MTYLLAETPYLVAALFDWRQEHQPLGKHQRRVDGSFTLYFVIQGLDARRKFDQ